MSDETQDQIGDASDSAADQPAILALDDARLEAMIAADTPRLGRILHPELVYVHSSGLLDRYDSYLARVSTREVRYTGRAHMDRSVVIAGSTAIVYGSMTLDVEVAGAAKHLAIRYQCTWTRDNGGWRMLGLMSASI